MSKPRKGSRELDVDGQKWRWFVGKGLNVVLWPPDGKRLLASVAKIRGTTPSIVERGQHKGTSDGALTPEQVRQYIRREVMA